MRSHDVQLYLANESPPSSSSSEAGQRGSSAALCHTRLVPSMQPWRGGWSQPLSSWSSQAICWFLPLMFGLLGSSQELLDVFGDLLRLADDVLSARQRGILHTLLPLLASVRGHQRAAVRARKQRRGLLSIITRLKTTITPTCLQAHISSFCSRFAASKRCPPLCDRPTAPINDCPQLILPSFTSRLYWGLVLTGGALKQERPFHCRSNISKISTKYYCVLQMFLLNGVQL